MTQAHSLVICNGRLKGDKEGNCTYRAHPKKAKNPKPTSPRHTLITAPLGSSDDPKLPKPGPSLTGKPGESLIDYFLAAHRSHHTSIHTSWAMREPTQDCHWPKSPRNQHECLCSTFGGGKRPKPAFPIQISPRSGAHRVAQNEQDFDSCELLSIQGVSPLFLADCSIRSRIQARQAEACRFPGQTKFQPGRLSGGSPSLATTQATILGHQRAAARQESIWESSIAAGQAETGFRRDGSSEKAFAPRHPVPPPKIWEGLAMGHVCAHRSHHTSIHTSWAMREPTQDCNWPKSPRNQHECLCSTFGGGKRPKPAFPIQISPRSAGFCCLA